MYVYQKTLLQNERTFSIVNLNSKNLQNLFRDAINIENLTKRIDITEYYLTHQDRRNYNQDDPWTWIYIASRRVKRRQDIFHPTKVSITIPEQIRKKKEEENIYVSFVRRPRIYNLIDLIRRNRRFLRSLIDEASSSTTSLPSYLVRRIKLINDNENTYRIYY